VSSTRLPSGKSAPRLRLAGQWRRIESELPERWLDAHLVLRLDDEDQARRAAALLAPLNPGWGARSVRLHAARGGGGAAPDALRRALARLDAERIHGELELVSVQESEKRAEAAGAGLATAWEAALTSLPPDWSDLLGEIRISSSDFLERAALLLSPANPARYGAELGFRFRCARLAGYGISPGMLRRCLERLDAERIRGEVRILRVLSDTKLVATQGPVWYLGGKVV